MGDMSQIFAEGSKVVISPDEMRAWVILAPPPKGVKYTVEAVKEWLPQHGVVYGVQDAMIQKALDSGKTFEMLEVARGSEPEDPEGGSFTMQVEVKPFTGLRANSDGSLIFDDLTFLQEVAEGQVLANVVAEKPGVPGRSVKGEDVPPKEPKDGTVLKGSGFEMSADGMQYIAPVRSHLNMVNNELVLTPVLHLSSLSAEDGPAEFEGNVVIEGDVHAGGTVNAGGSVFVGGRCEHATIKAGRNVLLGGGMRCSGEIGQVEAKENVWGQVFESVNIKAGGDVCANHLLGCDVKAEGRVRVAGGRGMVCNSSVYAKGGLVCQQLGDHSGSTEVSVGMGPDLIERFEGVQKRLVKLTQDIQNYLQNIATYEKLNRQKPDKGKNAPEYRDMVAKKDQAMSVLNILEAERARLKRTVDSFSAVNVVVRGKVFPGVVVRIDTRAYEVNRPMEKVKFKRDGDLVEAVSSTQEKWG